MLTSFKVIFLVMILMCSGCSMTILLEENKSEDFKNTHFLFVDNRPEEEKTFRRLTKSNFSHYYGDENFLPDRMDVLKNALSTAYGTKLNDHKVIITKFEFIAYIPKASQATNAAIVGVAIGGALGAIASGYYSEHSDKKDLFICIIEATIDGNKIIVEDAEPIPGFLDLQPAKQAGNALVHRLINNFTVKISGILSHGH